MHLDDLIALLLLHVILIRKIITAQLFFPLIHGQKLVQSCSRDIMIRFTVTQTSE